MERYRYMPHTADMQFVAYGKDFGNALENAALALLNIMLDIKKINKDRSKRVSVKIKESADSENELAWFVLQDILSKVDAEQLNAYSFKIKSLKCSRRISMTGELLCKKTKENYSLMSVKAVTPHDLKVKNQKKSCTIHVVVDV